MLKRDPFVELVCTLKATQDALTSLQLNAQRLGSGSGEPPHHVGHRGARHLQHGSVCYIFGRGVLEGFALRQQLVDQLG